MRHLRKHFIFEDLQLYKIEDFFQPLKDEGYNIEVYVDGVDENIIDVRISGQETKPSEFQLDKEEQFLKNRVEKIIPILLKSRYNMFEISSGVRRKVDSIGGHTSGADYYKKYVTGVDDKLHILSTDHISLDYRFWNDNGIDYEKYSYIILFDFKIKKLDYDLTLRKCIKK